MILDKKPKRFLFGGFYPFPGKNITIYWKRFDFNILYHEITYVKKNIIYYLL